MSAFREAVSESTKMWTEVSSRDKKAIRAQFRKRYRNMPDMFVKECIKWHEGEKGPTAYQIHILRAVAEESRVCIVGPHGLGKCVHEDEKLTLANGRRVRAGDLSGSSFRVKSVDLSLNVVESTAYAYPNGVKDVVEIVTDKGRVLRRTLNHPLWSDRTPYRWDERYYDKRLRPEGSWVPAGEIDPGMPIAVYRGHIGSGVDLDDEQIKIIGYLIGDGGISGQSSVKFSQEDGPALDEFRKSCARYNCTLTESNSIDYAVVCGSRRSPNPVLDLMRGHELQGKTSHEKRLPEIAWEMDRRQLALLINRIFACDGWAHCSLRSDGKRFNREIGLTTVSRGLATDLQSALLRFGIAAEVRRRRTTWTYLGEKKSGVAWSVGIHDAENGLKFCEEIGIYGKELAVETVRQSWLDADSSKTQKWRNYGLPDDFHWERVKSVKILRDQTTISISVPGPETFLTDFVEHNTSLFAWIILWFALTRDEEEDWKIPTTASAWRQLTKFLWPEVKKWARRIDWSKVGRDPFNENTELLTRSLKLETGEAFALASSDSNLIEGAHAEQILYIFDEAKVIPDATWDSAEGAMSTSGARWVAGSTPLEPIGRFHDIISRKSGYEDWWTRKVSMQECIQAGRMDPAWADNRRKQWGAKSALYTNRVRGEFAESDEDGVIPLSWVEAAVERWLALTEGEVDLGPLQVIGVDVGRFGPDPSVQAYRHGWVIRDLEVREKEDTMVTAGRVTAKLRANKTAIAIIDVNGIGAGVYDSCREHYPARAVAFNSSKGTSFRDKSDEFVFADTRSAAIWNFRELLDPKDDSNIALPDDDELVSEIVAPHYKVLSGGRIKVESKADIFKRLGRSTNKADAVVESFWDEDAEGGMAYA